MPIVVVTINLTDEQIKVLKSVDQQVADAYHAGVPGMMLAQVDGIAGEARVFFVDYSQAKEIQQVIASRGANIPRLHVKPRAGTDVEKQSKRHRATFMAKARAAARILGKDGRYVTVIDVLQQVQLPDTVGTSDMEAIFRNGGGARWERGGGGRFRRVK